MYWKGISRCQTLSEPFIEKYQGRVDWKYVLRYQKLSESFIKKHEDDII